MSNVASRNDVREDDDRKPSAVKKEQHQCSSSSSSSLDDPICCCLCGSAVDHADRSAFFEEDRNRKLQELEDASYDSDEYHWRQPKALLPKELYNPNNTMLLCDTCDRPYHQHCHFVPVLSIPKGDWHCMLCVSAKEMAGKPIEAVDDHNNNNNNNKAEDLSTQRKGSQRKSSKATSASKADRSDTTTTTKRRARWTKSLLEDELWACRPPPPNIQALQPIWEFQSRSIKVVEWKREFQRFRNSLKGALQQIRLTQAAIRTYTSTRRARQNFTLRSQELKQTFWKLASNKQKVRDWLRNAQEILREGQERMALYRRLEHFCRDEHPEEAEVWFPFGMNYPRRIVPRLVPPGSETAMAASSRTCVPVVPKEVVAVTKTSDSTSSTKNDKDGSKAMVAVAAKKKNEDDEDEDDLISLDDLKCVICFRGESTDHNDVVMCDGQNCFRAHHTQSCLIKPLSVKEVEEQENWFCPLCTTMAKLLAEVQSEYTGDEWIGEDDGESIHSWESAHDVFPESEEEMIHATKWKEGKADEATKHYLHRLFGMVKDEEEGDGMEEEDHAALMNDDDEEDDDFDLEKHEKDQKALGDEDGADDVSLQDSIGQVSKGELNALDSLSSEDDEKETDDEEEGQEAGTATTRNTDSHDSNAENEAPKPRKRKRRRTRSSVASSRTASRTNTSGEEEEEEGEEEDDVPRSPIPEKDRDMGKLDESNILSHKRRRRRVDYARLNDSMFGQLSASATKKIDDEDEFRFKGFQKDSGSESSSCDDESGDDGNDDEEKNQDGNDDQE